jgi:hypothetical protein
MVPAKAGTAGRMAKLSALATALSICSLCLHYVADKAFGIPFGIGILMLLLVCGTLTIPGCLRIPKPNAIVVGLCGTYVAVLVLSIPVGMCVEGQPYSSFLAETTRQLSGADYANFVASIPRSIPLYRTSTQIGQGLQYTATLPLSLVCLYTLFRHLAVRVPAYHRSILLGFYAVGLANVLFNLVEFSVPPLHWWLLLVGQYGRGEIFFSYRALSFPLNVYINAFLLLLFIAQSLGEFFRLRRKRHLAATTAAFAALLISGTRIGLIAGLCMAALFVFWYPFDRTATRMRYAVVGGALGLLCLVGIVVVKPDTLSIVQSIGSVQDKSGSAQLHTYYFMNSLDIIAQYPLGIGIGKSDFGGFASGAWLNTESHMLSLAIGAGVLSLLVFLLLNFALLRTSRAAGREDPQLFFIAPFGLAILLISAINMQVCQSLVPVLYTSVLYAMVLVQRHPAVPSAPRGRPIPSMALRW